MRERQIIMCNDILNEIYSKEYDDRYDKNDFIKNILIHFRNWKTIEESKEYKNLIITKNWKKIDEYRLRFDCDAYYYKNLVKKQDGTEYTNNEALHGDTMVSFWQPYKLAINLMHEENINKDKACLSSLIKNEQKYITDINNSFGGLFSDFARLCYTKGNFLLLPNGGRRMQSRGGVYEDRIDVSILECFPEIKMQTGKIKKGTYSKYFSNDFPLEKWIKDQKLDFVFLNGVISAETLVPFNDPPFIRFFYKNKHFIAAMTKEQLKTYLTKSIDLIKNRNGI